MLFIEIHIYLTSLHLAGTTTYAWSRWSRLVISNFLLLPLVFVVFSRLDSFFTISTQRNLYASRLFLVSLVPWIDKPWGNTVREKLHEPCACGIQIGGAKERQQYYPYQLTSTGWWWKWRAKSQAAYYRLASVLTKDKQDGSICCWAGCNSCTMNLYWSKYMWSCGTGTICSKEVANNECRLAKFNKYPKYKSQLLAKMCLGIAQQVGTKNGGSSSKNKQNSTLCTCF